ncbi:hypothetical protein ACFL4W_03745 [Planctomycetota bacterium]
MANNQPPESESPKRERSKVKLALWIGVPIVFFLLILLILHNWFGYWVVSAYSNGNFMTLSGKLLVDCPTFLIEKGALRHKDFHHYLGTRFRRPRDQIRAIVGEYDNSRKIGALEVLTFCWLTFGRSVFSGLDPFYRQKLAISMLRDLGQPEEQRFLDCVDLYLKSPRKGQNDLATILLLCDYYQEPYEAIFSKLSKAGDSESERDALGELRAQFETILVPQIGKRQLSAFYPK